MGLQKFSRSLDLLNSQFKVFLALGAALEKNSRKIYFEIVIF